MLINSNNLLRNAKENHYAVPAANFIDLNSVKAHTTVAEQRGLPLILAFAQSHRNLLSLEEAALLGKYYGNLVSTPIVLHLDHGEDIDYIKRAIDLGFTSVMIDASQQSFEENIRITKEVVDYAHPLNVSVEAELGHVGSNDYSESTDISDSIYTEVQDVITFVEATNIDSLAISIGTAHGIYKGKPKLNFERLTEIHNICKTPLVLHGGSSTGDDKLNRCATTGITKINIYFDFIKAAVDQINLTQNFADYPSVNALANKAMQDVLNHYYDVFETKSYSVK